MVYKMIEKKNHNFQKMYLPFQCYFLNGNTFMQRIFILCTTLTSLGTTVALSLLDA